METDKDLRSMTFEYKAYGNVYNLRLNYTTYRNNSTLALLLEEPLPSGESEPFGCATVNLPQSSSLAVNEQFIDTNNLPGIGAWLAANGIAHPTGMSATSGYCVYPVFAFNLPKEVESMIVNAREDMIADSLVRMIDESALKPVECTSQGDRYHIAAGTDIMVCRQSGNRRADVFLQESGSEKGTRRQMWQLRTLPSDVRQALAKDIGLALSQNSKGLHR